MTRSATPYVEPYVESVDPIEPPTVEMVGPFVDPQDSETPVPIVEPVAPIFADDTPTPAAAPEPEADQE